MAGWRMQAGICLALLIAAPLFAAEPQGPFARQLSQECHALMQAAIRRPYGWAWDNVPPAPAARNSTVPRHVTLEPMGTPAAGLLLLWSGQLLGEAKYEQAAIDTARGLAA